ncbi:ThiF family adenylyltransferase [Micromonospora chalcea]
MRELIVLVPHEAASRIRGSGSWGNVTFKVSQAQGAGFVHQISSGPDSVMLPVELRPVRRHFLNSGEIQRGGRWYRVGADLHVLWYLARRRTTTLKLESFKEFVKSGFVHPGKAAYIAITHAPGAVDRIPGERLPDLVAWHVEADGVAPLDIDSEPEVLGNEQLVRSWPLEYLQQSTVMVVGAGSIGGAATYALATYGVGRLYLVDPDRLRWHNLVRHVCGPEHVGRSKVSAVRQDVELLRPGVEVHDLELDVAQDANQIRALLTRTDIVVGATDGVASRRVISHLARRARLDAVLACVLEDGALGEILRLRPWPDRGCLTCQRHALRRAGAIDPEPAIDAGYGTGSRHRPMTAVGADLHLVGQLAAKTAVATLLERHGFPDQQLLGDHAVIALRPQPGRAAPFDLTHTGAIRWGPGTPPIPGCPTCEEP